MRFADALLEERKVAQLPPCVHTALLAAEAPHRADVDAPSWRRPTALSIAPAGGDVEVFSPVPALLARRAGLERGQIVVQSARRASLQRFLAAWRASLDLVPGRRARWSLDVDPAGFG
jgi:primosomal protein N' (replication factor Y)